MNIRDRKDLRSRRNAALAAAQYHPGKLALIYTAVAVGVSLILTVVDLLLTERIGETGGLSGMDLRTLLTTVKSVLWILSMALMPFWDMGFVYGAMKMSRQQKTGPGDLFRGFRRFGPVLRLKLLQVMIYMLLGVLSTNIGSMVFLMTPFAAPLAEYVMALDPTALDAAALDPVALAEAMEGVLLPMYLIMGLVAAVIILPVAYRFRMARYLILDDPETGALTALGTSNRLMRHNRGALLRLDLSFWWYYGLQLLCTAVAYSDVLAEALGVTLPVSATAAMLVCFVLYCLARLVVAWFFASPVETTYAVAYEALCRMQKDAEPRLVKNFPWDFLPEQNKPEED